MAGIVVAVSTDTQRERLLDGLLNDSADYDTVILESIERGYERITREQPDTVIVYLAIDDPAVCRLLSMLSLDPSTATIRVVTWAERFDGGALAALVASAIPEAAPEQPALSMN